MTVSRAWERLERPAKYEIRTEGRRRPENVKEEKVVEREFKNIRLRSEDVAEFAYSTTFCKKTYRVVVVRKNLSVENGTWHLFDATRYFFYITNDSKAPATEIVFESNARCNQENLIAQVHGVQATRMPVDNLLSNWAYMVMASLAWTLKAWFPCCCPSTVVGGRSTSARSWRCCSLPERFEVDSSTETGIERPRRPATLCSMKDGRL